jgi:hypothetical protein
MPATKQEEADALVQAGYGHEIREAADAHLREIKASADAYYGNQYRVYRCVVHPRVDSIKIIRELYT